MRKTIFSLEVFPPKRSMDVEVVYETLRELREVHADFISVTYGAGGSVNSKNTLDVAKKIRELSDAKSVVHMPALYMTREKARKTLEEFALAGVESILALRGDRVEGLEPCGDFLHASDLIRFIKTFDSERKDGKHFDIYAACYPECHIESKDVFSDLQFQKLKVDVGASHLLSQLFFDNEKFYRFLERARLVGITSPIEAGIMCATNKKSIEKMISLSNAALPEKYKKMLSRYENDKEALLDAGVAYAIDQIVDLVSNGVDGIHLYTMNNSAIAKRIYDATKSLFSSPPLSLSLER